jgi:nitroreductase
MPYRWVVLREQKTAGALSRLLGTRAVQSLLHCVDALYDLLRYLRFFTPLHARTRERRKLEALIFVHYHKIEKTLALPNPPSLFGTSYLGKLLDLLDTWVRSIGDLQAVAFRAACGALWGYRDRVGRQLEREYPDLSARLESQLAQYGSPGGGTEEGGTQRLTAGGFRSALGAIDFQRLALSRHSVRNFSTDPVPDEAIARAVRIAQRTPSVCNRQAWRVHVYTAPEDKEVVLRTQDGNAGFGHLAARVLLVSSDTRVYVTSGERHQAYVDGGMFAMTLVYALQAEGIVSCCLNLCNYFFQDLAVHRACRIPAWEIPIMMIAIGYPALEYQVAASARLDTDSVLAWRVL